VLCLVACFICLGALSELESQAKANLLVSIPRNEACISNVVSPTVQVNASDATVSVKSWLVPKRVRRIYERADRALTQHNLEAAQRELKKAISAYPKFAVGWCRMGALHEEQLQLDDAFADYSQAVAIDSQLLPACLGLARIAFREQRSQQVVKFTDKVTKVNPVAFTFAYLYSAAAQFHLGNLSAAEQNARKFQSFDTDHEHPQGYLLLGDILTNEHDYAGAAEQKLRFLELDPNAYDARDQGRNQNPGGSG
jgi:tetratricopeptide (TPR) repeat protein